MIIADVTQGSDEWFAARAGIPTSSEFSKIYTATGKKSTQATGYRNKLLASWLMGHEPESFTSDWMNRGKEFEAEARAYYDFQGDGEVVEVGFCYMDDRKLCGASPDGLVGDDGGLEIKVPAPHTHVATLLAGKMPSEHIPQVQGCMMVTDAKWWDFLSYSPGLPPFLARVERDTRYVMGLRAALDTFITELLAHREMLTIKGYTPGEQT